MSLKSSTIRVHTWSLLVISLLLILGIWLQCNIWLMLTLILMIILMDRFSFSYSNHIFFLLYLIAFFVFLVGGQTVHDFFGYPMVSAENEEEYTYLNQCIFLSLVSITVGYVFAKLLKKPQKQIYNPKKTKNIQDYRTIGKYSFYVLSLPWYAILVEQCLVVQRGGYLDLYTYSTRLPAIIDQMSEACPIAFCLFLATLPSKKEAKVPFYLFFFYACVSLLIGRRMYFVVYTLLIIGYMVVRNHLNNGKEVWISKRQIWILVLITPAVIILLYAYRYTRYGKTVEAKSVIDAFLGFFSQQGGSANLIVYGKRYANELGNDLYSFYGILRFLRINYVSRFIFGLDYIGRYTGTRINLAFNSGSFARRISYITMKVLYIRGYGAGSCYVAELYHDFGYWGIILGNLIYGYLMGRVMFVEEGRTIKNLIALLFFLKMLMAPRYNFDSPFVTFISLNFWSYCFFIYIALLFKRYIRRKKTHSA